MKVKKYITGIVGSIGLAVVCKVEAATVQYLMDQSNELEDGIGYIVVTVSNNVQGQVDFLLEPQAAIAETAGSNFGIQSFALSLQDTVDPSAYSYPLPDGWRVSFDRNVSEAGRFDVLLQGTGHARQDPLRLSIIGLAIEDIEPWFASHVADFSYSTGSKGSAGITSAFFYGGNRVAVPLPAAFWLFGAGLLVLLGVAGQRAQPGRQVSCIAGHVVTP